ncbi:alanine racemase [Sorangium sp. So ce1024]|uniref:alanine racemase n=1 Tax=Sorangium sp. So ce1024 TaxID=3133327 RepID=UPI003F0D70F7
MSASHASTELGTSISDRNGTTSAVEGLGASPGAVRVLRPRRAAPADAVRPTRAEVNLAHLRHNLRVLERAMPGARRPEIWGVLKADAYGHGAPAVARTLERAGIPGLCVALLEEAIELRDAGIRLPVLVMGGYYGPRREGFEEILARDLVPVVYDAGQIERLASVVRLEQRGRVGVHLKVDTGMGRLGAASSELDAVLATLTSHPEVRLDGLMTHLACADADDLGVTLEQMKRFEEIEERARRFGLTPRVRHASNSAAMLRLPAARLDVVRPGVALFGISPRAGLAPDLKPVIRVRSEIVALRTVAKGDSIGYGHTWQASRDSVVATVPMGYADGLSRQLSNRGAGLVRGQRAPIAGTVSMDLTMLDVTDVPGARVGDEVVFLGAQDGPLGRATISAEEIAGLTGTIAWEVLTSISRRVPRFYREP